MSESAFPPFLHWGDYKANDEKHPDVLNIEVLETEMFDTEYGINIRTNVDGIEKALPLHNYNSKNKQLLKLWTDATKQGKIKIDTKLKILTWLGTSKNKHPIRRFELVF